MATNLGRPALDLEGADETVKALRGRGEFSCRLCDLVRRVRGFLRRDGDLLGGAARAPGDGRDVFQRAGDSADASGDPFERTECFLLDDRDGVSRDALDGDDQLTNRPCGTLGLLGQRTHLVGDHGEAAAVFAGASGLDRRVQSEEFVWSAIRVIALTMPEIRPDFSSRSVMT